MSDARIGQLLAAIIEHKAKTLENNKLIGLTQPHEIDLELWAAIDHTPPAPDTLTQILTEVRQIRRSVSRPQEHPG